MICYTPIAYQFLDFAAERILKGIADNFSGYTNEANYLYSPNLG
jgi:hypothetical protein